MKIVGWFLAILLGLIAVVFATNNFRSVAIDLWPLPYTISLPLFILVLVLLLLGFLGGLIASFLAAGHRRRSARRQKREIRTLRSEVSDLRNVPATTGAGSREAERERDRDA